MGTRKETAVATEKKGEVKSVKIRQLEVLVDLVGYGETWRGYAELPKGVVSVKVEGNGTGFKSNEKVVVFIPTPGAPEPVQNKVLDLAIANPAQLRRWKNRYGGSARGSGGIDMGLLPDIEPETTAVAPVVPKPVAPEPVAVPVI
jgi:hypothetical protein